MNRSFFVKIFFLLLENILEIRLVFVMRAPYISDKLKPGKILDKQQVTVEGFNTKGIVIKNAKYAPISIMKLNSLVVAFTTLVFEYLMNV